MLLRQIDDTPEEVASTVFVDGDCSNTVCKAFRHDLLCAPQNLVEMLRRTTFALCGTHAAEQVA